MLFRIWTGIPFEEFYWSSKFSFNQIYPLIIYFSIQLEKGIPGDPRFPDRDNEWIEARTKDKELLVEWLEDFKSKLGEYQESQETIIQCENVLNEFTKVVDPVKIPLMIQNARNARQKDGSCLEYGLDYHLNNMNESVSC